MPEKNSLKKFFSENWLFLLIIAQPLLDVLAFWTRSDSGTAAGYIRLLVMLILPLHLLCTRKEKKSILISFAIIGLLTAAHAANLFRVGYIEPVGDMKNMAKILYMPVMSVCLCSYVKDDRMKKQVVAGLLANVIILALIIVVSYVTGTYTPTYGNIHGLNEGLGISAWVIDENRCTHSIILCALSIFAMYFGLSSRKAAVNYFIPAAVLVACITNGTSSAYLTCLACFAGYAVFIVFAHIVRKEKIAKAGKLLVVYLLLLMSVSILIYPITPQAKITEIERAAANKRQKSLEDELMAMGYDVRKMSAEEKMANPEIREKMAKFYTETIFGGAPGLIKTFDVYRIMEAYDYSTDALEIADVRKMKRVNARLIWEDSDMLTKFTGFEFAKVDWPEYSLDLENDWHSIFYYYGVLGFAVYVLYILTFFIRIILRLCKDFSGNMSLFNFCLIMCFVILLGLAHFSGALLKRPNSSIYLALLMALLNYQLSCPTDRTSGGII